MTLEGVDVCFQLEVETLRCGVNQNIDYLLEDLKVVILTAFILQCKLFCQEINSDQ